MSYYSEEKYDIIELEPLFEREGERERSFNTKSKQGCNRENNKESNKERRRKTGNQYNDGRFIYSWKAEKKSWIIGDTSRSSKPSNAIYNGDENNCPDELVFNPREYEDNIDNIGEEKEGPVEEVGRFAFAGCGYCSNTTKVVVPKEVKIIREGGYSWMYNVTEFIIEIGSQLESIEDAGLHGIGYSLEDRTDSGSFSPYHQKNLILPRTLNSVSDIGTYYCNRFTRIIYCGNHNLNQNSSELEGDTIIQTKVYITPDYEARNGNSIFGRVVSGVLSEDEIDIACPVPQPTPAPSQSPFPPHFNSRCSPLQMSLPSMVLSLCFSLINLNDPSLFYSPHFSSFFQLEF